MARLKPGEKRVQLSFQRPEDVALFKYLEPLAYKARLGLPDFILESLQQAFQGQFAVSETDEASPPVSPE